MKISPVLFIIHSSEWSSFNLILSTELILAFIELQTLSTHTSLRRHYWKFIFNAVFRFTSFDIFQYICLSSMLSSMYSRNLEIYRHVYSHVSVLTLSLRYTSRTSSYIRSPVHFNNSFNWYFLSKRIFSLRFILWFIFRAILYHIPNSFPRAYFLQL